MNKCWAFDIKSLLFSAQFFWFKLPLIMSGCWNKRVGSSYYKRVGSSYYYGVTFAFSNSRVLNVVWLENVVSIWVMWLLGSRSYVCDVWVWLIIGIWRWDGYWFGQFTLAGYVIWLYI